MVMPEKSPAAERFAPALDLGFVVFITALMRLIALSEESVWLDEFFSVAYLDRPTLGAFLHDQRAENWEMVPLYYSLQYAWHQAFGGETVHLRVLSILFGSLTAGLLYGAGRAWFGRMAGLVAAVLFALSPFQQFHGQGLRPYAMVTLLGVAGAVAFLQGLQGRQPRHTVWLALSVTCNGLLMWTHLFTPLLMLAQGVAFLVLRPGWAGRWVTWGAVHGVLLLPVVAWVSTITPAPPAPVAPASAGEALRAVLGTDTSTTFWVLSEDQLAGTAHAPLFGWMGALHQAHILLMALAAVALVLTIRRAAQGGQGCYGVDTWLLIWLVVPFTTLWVLAHVWIPSALQPRYAIYSLPALYLAMGAGLGYVRRPGWRAVVTGLVLAPMLAHGVMATLLPMRPDYQGVAHVLRAEARPGDTVAADDFNVLRVLALQARVPELDFVYASWEPEAPEALHRIIPERGGAWVLFAGTPGHSAAAERFEELLHARGWPWQRHVFAGMRKLYLYRVEPQITRLPNTNATQGAPSTYAEDLADRQAYQAVMRPAGHTK